MAVNKEYIDSIRKLREYLRDYIEDNILLEDKENSDSQLQESIVDAIDYINTAYPPVTAYTISDIPSWTMARDRAVIIILESNFIRSARNQVTYTDAGGVNIREEDVYGRYINIRNVLLAKNELHIQRTKASLNANEAYGGVDSEFIYNYGYNRNDRY